MFEYQKHSSKKSLSEQAFKGSDPKRTTVLEKRKGQEGEMVEEQLMSFVSEDD